MEIQYLLDAVLGFAAMFLGWTVTRIYHSIDDLWRKHDEVTQRLTKLAIELPQQYVTKQDLSKAVDVIHDRFDKLEDKLESYHNPH
jgi:predicted nuclease with TOPRIM domain